MRYRSLMLALLTSLCLTLAISIACEISPRYLSRALVD